MHMGLGHRYQDMYKRYTSELFHLVTTPKSNKKDPENGENRWTGNAAKAPRLSIPQRQVKARELMSNQTLSRSYLTALYDINFDIITALPITPRTNNSLIHTHSVSHTHHLLGKKCRNRTR